MTYPNLRNSRSITKAVYDRLVSINKRVSSGRITEGDIAVLSDGYAQLHGDSQLSMARSNAARPGEEDREGGIPFIISTYTEDRDGDIVVPSGCRLKEYARNPVVFFSHQQHPIPIGTSRAPDGSLAVFIEPDKIRATWYPDYEDPDASFIASKVKRKILSAASLAFIPLEAVRRDSREEEYAVKARHDRSPQMPPGWIFKVYSVTEWSVVGVPSNAGAIRDSLDREKAWISPRLQKSLSACAADAKGMWPGGIGSQDKVPLDYETYLNRYVASSPEKDKGIYIHSNVAKTMGLTTQADIESTWKPTTNPPPGTRRSQQGIRIEDLEIEERSGRYVVVNTNSEGGEEVIGGPFDHLEQAEEYIQTAIDQLGMNSAVAGPTDAMRDAIGDRYKSEQARRLRIMRAYGITGIPW